MAIYYVNFFHSLKLETDLHVCARNRFWLKSASSNPCNATELSYYFTSWSGNLFSGKGGIWLTILFEKAKRKKQI